MTANRFVTNINYVRLRNDYFLYLDNLIILYLRLMVHLHKLNNMILLYIINM